LGAAFGFGCKSMRGLSTVNGCDGSLDLGAMALAGGGGGTRFAGGSSDAAGSRERYPKTCAPANVSSRADLLGGFGGAGGVGVLGFQGGGCDGGRGVGPDSCDGATAELPAADDEATGGDGSAGTASARQAPVSGSPLRPSAANDFEGRAASSARVTSPRWSLP